MGTIDSSTPLITGYDGKPDLRIQQILSPTSPATPTSKKVESLQIGDKIYRVKASDLAAYGSKADVEQQLQLEHQLLSVLNTNSLDVTACRLPSSILYNGPQILAALGKHLDAVTQAAAAEQNLVALFATADVLLPEGTDIEALATTNERSHLTELTKRLVTYREAFARLPLDKRHPLGTARAFHDELTSLELNNGKPAP